MAKKNNLSAYARFSTVAIQMAVVIGLSVWLGDFLDQYLSNETPWLTIVLSLVGVFVGLYLVIKEVINTGKETNE